MDKRNIRTPSNSNALDFFRGGKAPPEFVRQRMAAAERELAAQDQNRRVPRQVEKFFRQIQKPNRPKVGDPKVIQATGGLLDIYKKLGRQRIIAPGVLAESGGILQGRFEVKLTPPFDYAFAIKHTFDGGPTVSSSANKNGQLDARSVTEFEKRSFASAYAECGVFFHPFFGPAKLRVSANPSYTRQWWTNSLSAADLVKSFGSIVVGMFGQQGRTGPTKGNVGIGDLWDEQSSEQVRFDLGSSPSIAPVAELEVDPSFAFSVFVAIQVSALGTGWPGSLAGAIIAAVVPSITIELDLIPVASPG